MTREGADRRLGLRPLAWAGLALLGAAALGAATYPTRQPGHGVAVGVVLGLTAAVACATSVLAARTSEGSDRAAWWLTSAACVAAVLGAVWIATGGDALAQFSSPITAAIIIVASVALAAALVRLLPTVEAGAGVRLAWAIDGLLTACAAWVVIWVFYGLVGPLASSPITARTYAALYAAAGLTLVVVGGWVWLTMRAGPRSARWLAGAVVVGGCGLVIQPWWFLGASTDGPGGVVVKTLWIVAIGMIGVAGLRRAGEPRVSVAHLRDRPPRLGLVTISLAAPLAVVVASAVAASAGLWAPWSADERRLAMLAGLLLVGAAVARTVMVSADEEDVAARLLVDPLTGLFNGRYMRARLSDEFRAAQETGSRLSVAMVDLDDFAAANAACGRGEGDAVLQAIGERLAVEQGPELIVARTGGDEFTLLLPGADLAEAGRRVSAIVRAIASASVPACRVTASAGVVSVAGAATASGPDELLERADRALYWAKYHGKDAVAAWDPRLMGERFDTARPGLADRRALAALVRALAAANDAREVTRRDHSRNVARLAVRLGRELGLDEGRLATLENAALLHDIGLVCVPDAMLDRPRELDPQERDQLEEHPEVGARILAGTEMGYLAPLVAAHHERWDGTGYPCGLAGEAIPLESRIIAACDTYDGTTSARPHHGARDRKAGIAAITEGMTGSLDPTVAERLVTLLVSDEEQSW